MDNKDLLSQVLQSPELAELINKIAEEKAEKIVGETKAENELLKQKLEEVTHKMETQLDAEEKFMETTNKTMDTINGISENNKAAVAMIGDLSASISYLYEQSLQGEKQLFEAIEEIGKKQTNAKEVVVYGVENNRVFVHDDKGNREFVDIQDSLLQQAIDSKEAVTDNLFFEKGRAFADDNRAIKNIMLSPMVDSKGNVIAVAVAKDKIDKEGNLQQFTDEDKAKFDPKDTRGTGIGAVIITHLEKTYNESTANYYRNLATHDHMLKDLYNRSGAEEQIKTEIYNAIMEDKTISFALTDIDKFKSFNDTYGHDKGDEVLKIVADNIQSVVREGEGFVFRFGGEEIGMILIIDKEDAYKVVDRARQKVEDTPLHVEINGKNEEVQITFSAGMAEFSQATLGEDVTRDNIWEKFNEVVFKQADNNLYEAKEQGRNRVYSDVNLYEELPHMTPTEYVRSTLNSLELSLLPNEDGNTYTLYDDLKNCEYAVVENSSDLISVLKKFENEFISRIDELTQKEGLKPIQNMDIAARNPNYKNVFKEGGFEIGMLNVLENKANEIKLELIANVMTEAKVIKEEPAYEAENKVEPQKKNPPLER